MRVGIGYDIHRLAKGRKLLLGGVPVPYSKGLLGHSDGDVLLHAVTDALLGAAGLGDMGDHFPDTDRRFQGADSRGLLASASALLKKKKLVVRNVDAVLILEAPRLSAYRPRMARSIAAVLGISSAQVNVKAKTNEGLDSTGRGAAIACYAVVSLKGR